MALPRGYSARQIRLHWIVVALIALQFLLSDSIESAWDAPSAGLTASSYWLIWAHILGGVLILLFAFWRLGLRQIRGVPPAPEVKPEILKLAAHLGHLGLYALMIAMPLSGAVAWFGGIKPAAEAHGLLKMALIALMAAHVGAALWHQFWLKDGLLLRMKRPLD